MFGVLGHNLIVVAFTRGDADVIQQEIAAMPRSEHRSALRDVYWEAMGEYEGPRAWAMASNQTDEDDRAAAELHLMSGWANADFSGSFDWAIGLSSEARRDAALGAVIQSWGRGARSSEVAEIIARLPDDLGEKTVLGMARQFANLDPVATMKWAETIANSSLREEMQQRVIKSWTTQQPEEAREYIRSLADLNIRGALLWSYLFARFDNHTLTMSDLDEILTGFSKSWKVYLLKRLVVAIVDPSTGADAFIRRTDFATKVEARSDLSDSDKMDILAPLGGR